MSLLQAGIGAAGGVLTDRWREFFYCDALEADVLATRDQKRTTGRSSNVHELTDAMNEELSEEWTKKCGIAVASVAVNTVTPTEEYQQMLKDLQKAAVMCDPTMAAANVASARSDAMRMAVSNEAGAMNGFMGMASGMGGSSEQALFGMGQQQDCHRTGFSTSAGSRCLDMQLRPV